MLILFLYLGVYVIIYSQSEGEILGLPSKNGKIIHYSSFSLSYEKSYEQASWVAYKLTKSEALSKSFPRKGSFRMDKRLKTASKKYYKASKYDLGHLCPAGDNRFSKQAMYDSFYMSNISPQIASFNRGIWKRLEIFVHNLAISESAVFIVTGGVLKKELKKLRGVVSIPDEYYKVIINKNLTKGIAFLLPNKKSTESISNYVKTIDEIEKITNLDFFNNLEDSLENKLESVSDFNNW